MDPDRTRVKMERFIDGDRRFDTKENGGDSQGNKEAEAILNGASGFLRRQLSRVLKIRTVPQLRFYYDKSIARGTYLSGLIDKAIDEDSRHDNEDD